MKIGFFLMTEKGLRVLESVCAEFGPEAIAYVITARDPNVANDHSADIDALCRNRGIPCFDRSASAPFDAGCHFAISWRWMIRDAANLIVLHDSLLPRYRGFAPLPTALINGEPVVGVTALFAGDEYDRGDILGQKRLPVCYPARIQDVIAALSLEYGALVVELCRRIRGGEPLAGVRQNEAEATYSLWRDEEDYCIRWSDDAVRIRRFIDSVGYPYKGASSRIDGKLVRILAADVEPDVVVEDRSPGKVIFVRDGVPVVVCGRGLLRVTDLRSDATGETLLPLRKFRSRFI